MKEGEKKRMDPLINVDVSLYFEVSNSDMYGGQDTVGYTAIHLESVGNLAAIDDSFLSKQREYVARLLKVTKEDVKSISKEEYDQEMEGEYTYLEED